MLNRCKNTALNNEKVYLDAQASHQLRQEIDAYIENKVVEWNATVPFAQHFEGNKIHDAYYERHLIETIWRIRLLRVVEGKALAEIAKVNTLAAQIWANYESEEMTHDELFAQDLKARGVSRETILSTEPYLSTKLLSGFFSYLLDHEGPLGVVAYSYLVETVNVKMEPKKLSAMKISLGEQSIRGQIAHSHTDTQDDHPGEVWQVVRHLINSKDDIKNLYRYLNEMQEILAMYFREIHKDQVKNKMEMAA